MPEQGNKRRPKQTEADRVQYFPGAVADFPKSGSPDTVQQAIDRLASNRGNDIVIFAQATEYVF